MEQPATNRSDGQGRQSESDRRSGLASTGWKPEVGILVGCVLLTLVCCLLFPAVHGIGGMRFLGFIASVVIGANGFAKVGFARFRRDRYYTEHRNDSATAMGFQVGVRTGLWTLVLIAVVLILVMQIA